MKRGYLSDYFVDVSVKRLSAVDAEPKRSNQHEVGTTKKMRDTFLGERHGQKFQAKYIWLDREQEGIAIEGKATHYDARRKKPHRSPEWRLYYHPNAVTEKMKGGDTLFLARDRNSVLYFIVTAAGSTSEQQLSWLFGFQETLFGFQPAGTKFSFREVADGDSGLDFAGRFILDEIGIDFEEPDASKLDRIIAKFKSEFPTTKEFSKCARDTLPEVRAEDDADAALVAWVEHEEALFRRLERRIVSHRLKHGFAGGNNGPDVDGFIKFSLGVQNRRKVRMGHSLENHIAAVFDAYKIKYERGAVTEDKNKPDFLFPGASAYQRAPKSGDKKLAMLGAKSTCKDRWRQVLAEAKKIPRKHLLTLEPGISQSQTNTMQKSKLQLVVPESIQATYTEAQQSWLWTFDGFIRDIAARQGRRLR